MDYNVLNELSKETFANNVKWWTDLKTGESTVATRNRPEIMMLIVTELSEANDGLLNDRFDDKLPQYPMVDVELADAAIRLHDVLGAEGIQVSDADWDEVNLYLTAYDRKAQPELHTSATLTEFLMSIVDLVSEAMEGYRKQTKPEMRLQYERGLAKALVACYYVADEWNIDLPTIIDEKQAFNKVRPDHQIENRLKEGGKAC